MEIIAPHPRQISDHGHPNPSPQPLPESDIRPLDLHADPSKFHDPENFILLINIFSRTQSVEFDDRFLLYRFNEHELPPKPWPKKIAGVPCYLTTDEEDNGPMSPTFRLGNSGIHLFKEYDYKLPLSVIELFNLVYEACCSRDIAITEVQFWGDLIVIVLSDTEAEADMDEVEAVLRSPESVANCKCHYLFESEIARPRRLIATRAPPPLTPETDFFSCDMEAAGTNMGDHVVLDRYRAEDVQGVRGPPSLVKVPIVNAGDSEHEHMWIRCRWDYMGQDSHEIMRESAPLSSIFNGHDQAVGLFRYAPSKGVFVDWCLSTTADPIGGRYTIA